MSHSTLHQRPRAVRRPATVLGALALGATLLSGALWAAQDQSQAQLLQEGVTLMETKGDYKAALAVFERVARGPDRSLAARGWLYLGLAQERLGGASARATYERLLREYADQADVAAQARARLTALGGGRSNLLPPRTMTARRLWGADFTPTGPPSRDGHIVPGVTATGEFAVRDLITLETRKLAAANPAEVVTDAISSPDGLQLASGWWLGGGTEFEVRVSGAAGERPRALVKRRVQHAQLWGWLPGGRDVVVAWFESADGPARVAKLDVSTGQEREVGTLSTGPPRGASISPDGRYALYDFLAAPSAVERDIGILDLNTGASRPLVVHRARDQMPTWTPDGRVLFASDRTGTLGLWLAEVADGLLVGEPQLVRRDVGALVSTVGVSSSGALYYRLDEGLVDVHVATIGSEGQSAPPPARVARRVEGINLFPDWAPDNRRIVYTSRSGIAPLDPGGMQLVVADTETNEERTLSTEIGSMRWPRWSPDGRAIAVPGVANGVDGIHRVDAETGAVHTFLTQDSARPEVNSFEWTPDSRAIVYTARGNGAIERRDVDTGARHVLFTAPEGRRLGAARLSHDGSRLAVPLWLSDGEVALAVVPTSGGAPLTIFSAARPETFAIAGWGAGDEDVYVVAWTATGPDVPRRLLRVPAGGGQAATAGLVVPTMRDARVSPNGRRIAYTAGWPTRAAWVLENFLPPPRAAKAGDGKDRARP